MRPISTVTTKKPALPSSHSREDGFADDAIVAHSGAMRRVLARVDSLAAHPVSVCIVGETGTGKELISRTIHRRSRRRDRPFFTVDVTTIPAELFETALFGHVRGAFTGAVDERGGLLAQAHTGTLFIDELGELPLHLQAKLLRVIQSKEFTPVGGSKPVRSDFRLITATNKDLAAMVRRGEFRVDLFYRIAVATLELPPLRDRPEDLPILIATFVRRFARLYGKAVTGLSPRAMRLLTDYSWPGNVRQLQNWIEHAIVLADEPVIDVDALPAAESRPTTGVTNLKVRGWASA